MAVAYILNKDFITLTINCEPKTISAKHELYEKIKAAVLNEDWEVAEELMDTATMCIKYLSGKLELYADSFNYNGVKLNSKIVSRILKMRKNGDDPEYLIKFIENLMQNPNAEAIHDLFDFIEAGNMPITEDGHFLAYRAVTKDFKDFHTNSIDNSVGNIVAMRREDCQLNRNETCSTGLHFCAKSYFKSMFGGGTKIIVKVNPKDVTSIPIDYNQAKGRTCRFEVIGLHQEKHEKEVFSKTSVDSKSIALTKEEKKFIKIYKETKKYPTITSVGKALEISARTVQRWAEKLMAKGVENLKSVRSK